MRFHMLLPLLALVSLGAARSNKYKVGEEITLFANKVGEKSQKKGALYHK